MSAIDSLPVRTSLAIAILAACSIGHAESLLPGIAGEAAAVTPTSIRLLQEPMAGNLLGKASATVSGANFLRLHLTVVAPTTMDGVTITVLDGFAKPVETIDLHGTKGVREIWTKLIPGDEYRVRVLGPSQQKGASVIVENVIRNTKPMEPLSIFGSNDMQPITEVTDAKLLDAARATAKLIFQKGTDAYVCTAFLVSPRLMMTNQHCIEDPSICPTVVVQFDLNEGQVVSADKQRRCSAVKASDYALDFTVFELDQPADPEIKPLQFAATSPTADSALTIVEHPAGEAKKISQIGCKVHANPVNGRAKDTDFSHTCDTLGGSSGSGVLDTNLKIVGLHHLGIGGDEPTYNRAIRIEPIVAKLRDTHVLQTLSGP